MKYDFQSRIFEDVDFIVNGITVFGTVDDTEFFWTGHDDNNHHYVIRNTDNKPKIVIDGDYVPSAEAILNSKVLCMIEMGYMNI